MRTSCRSDDSRTVMPEPLRFEASVRSVVNHALACMQHAHDAGLKSMTRSCIDACSKGRLPQGSIHLCSISLTDLNGDCLLQTWRWHSPMGTYWPRCGDVCVNRFIPILQSPWQHDGCMRGDQIEIATSGYTTACDPVTCC